MEPSQGQQWQIEPRSKRLLGRIRSGRRGIGAFASLLLFVWLVFSLTRYYIQRQIQSEITQAGGTMSSFSSLSDENGRQSWPSFLWRLVSGNYFVERIQKVGFGESAGLSDVTFTNLAKLPDLIEIDFRGQTLTTQQFECVCESPSIRNISLQNTKVGPARKLALGPTMTSLTVAGTSANDDFLRAICQTSALRRLQIFDANLSAGAVVYLAEMKSLKELTIAGSASIGNVGAKMLATLSSLEELDLHDSLISDSGLAHICRLTNLRSLNLSQTDITGEGLRFVRELPGLRQLEIKGISISDEGKSHLASMRHLKRLMLGPGISIQAAAELSRLIPGCRIEVWNKEGNLVQVLEGTNN